jgi:hypothetical protein
MSTIVVYFTQTGREPHNANIGIFNYYYNGDELLVPPLTCVICIPCKNRDPNHEHNVRDCILHTHSRQWDYVRLSDFITIYVLDNESVNESLVLDGGELLGSFLCHNQGQPNLTVQKAMMCVDPYLPEAPDSDGGYDSTHLSDEE